MATAGASLEQLTVENSFTAELPGDSDTRKVVRQVHGALWSVAEPTSTNSEPTTIAASPEVCSMLGLDVAEAERPEFAMIFSGNAPLPGGKPYAQVCAPAHGAHMLDSPA